MARIIIASASETNRQQFARLLASSGFEAWRLCASGGEIRRALSDWGDGIILIAGNLPDESVDQLAEDLDERSQILWIARAETLARGQSRKTYRLGWPCSGQMVIGAMEVLTQLHSHMLPHRGDAERDMLEKAKAGLMAREHITEPEAHHLIQKYAMQKGIKMAAAAEKLLKDGG